MESWRLVSGNAARAFVREVEAAGTGTGTKTGTEICAKLELEEANQVCRRVEVEAGSGRRCRRKCKWRGQLMPERDGEPHGAAGVHYQIRCNTSSVPVTDDHHQDSPALYPHSRITLPVLEATPSSSSSTCRPCSSRHSALPRTRSSRRADGHFRHWLVRPPSLLTRASIDDYGESSGGSARVSLSVKGPHAC